MILIIIWTLFPWHESRATASFSAGQRFAPDSPPRQRACLVRGTRAVAAGSLGMMLLALALGLLGPVLIYLAHPNQGLRMRALPVAWRYPGALSLLAAMAAWTLTLGLSAGVFAWLTNSMLVWVLLPYFAWLRYSRQPARPVPAPAR